MSEKNEPIFGSEDFQLLLQKYEKLKNGIDSGFFDVEEFEQIIDYYLDEFQFEAASEAAELGARQHPASIELKYKFVHIHLEQGNAPTALKILDEIPSWEHSNSEFHYLKGTALCQSGKLKEAEKAFDHALSIADEEIFEALLNISIAFENARHFELAVKYLEKAIKMDPESLSVLYDLGYFHERLDTFERSVDYYQQYLDIDPFSENVWYNLGVVYFKLEEPEKAIEAYDYSIAINPDYASAYFNKANAWASLGNYEKAIDAFLDFVAIEPDNAQAYTYLGECYEQIEQYDKALEAFQRVIEIDNTDPEGWFGAGMIYYHRNEFKQAIAYVLKSLEFDGNNTDYWLNLGYIYEEAEMMEEAYRCYLHITKTDPADVEAWHALTGLLIKQGAYEKALEPLREAYIANPDDGVINLKMAIAHYMLGNKAPGIRFLEKALQVNPGIAAEFEKTVPAKQFNRETRNLLKKYNQNK
jgi:tetratricopeptide (TPR) repeat protein